VRSLKHKQDQTNHQQPQKKALKQTLQEQAGRHSKQEPFQDELTNTRARNTYNSGASALPSTFPFVTVLIPHVQTVEMGVTRL
jgi:Tfp pilus assembly protein PilO